VYLNILGADLPIGFMAVFSARNCTSRMQRRRIQPDVVINILKNRKNGRGERAQALIFSTVFGRTIMFA